MAIGELEISNVIPIELRPKKVLTVGLFVPEKDIPRLSRQNLINIGKLYFRTLDDGRFFEQAAIKMKVPKPQNATEAKVIRNMCLKNWEELPVEEQYEIVVRHPRSILNEWIREYNKAIHFMLDGSEIVSALLISEREKGFSLSADFPFVENGINSVAKVRKWLKVKDQLFSDLGAEGYKYLFAIAADEKSKKLLELIGSTNKGFRSIKQLDSSVYNGKITRYSQYRFKLK